MQQYNNINNEQSIAFAPFSSMSSQLPQYRAVSSVQQSVAVPSSSFNKRKSDSIAVVVALPQQVNKHQRASQCEERPCFLGNHHFFANQSNYQTLEMQIESVLSSWLREHSNEVDYAYFVEQTQWRMKYMNGSTCHEIHVNVYYDSNANDHVIEVNRVRGDGMIPIMGTFFQCLRQHVLGLPSQPPRVASPMRRAMPCPPALKRGGVSAPIESTNQLFMKGIQPILSMAADQFYEPRLEAAKSFCDLAQRSEQLLSIPECMEGVVHALNNLLMDEFDDVKQFAVMACSLFAQLPSYKQSLSRMPQLRVLAELVLEGPADESVSFETAQMRRRACLALTLIAEKEAEAVCECLKEQNVRSFEAWRSCVSKMDDPRLVDHANKLEMCIVY